MDEIQPTARRRQYTRHSAWVLGIALLLRVLVVAGFCRQHGAAFLFKNGLEMSLLAQSLLHGQGLSSPFGPPTGPTAFIAPVYPMLVAAVFWIFGSYTNASALIMMGLHIAANLGTIALMMHLARRVFDERAAVIGGVLWAVSPPLLFMPTIFWETSFSCCLILGLLSLALWVRDEPNLTAWLTLGAYAGAMALVNPALILTISAVIGGIVLVAWRRLRPRDVALGAFIFVLVFCAWPIRNARVFQAFVPLRTTVGFELWMGNQPGSTGFLNESLFPTFNHAELNQYNRMGEIAYTDEKSALGKRYILAHPATFVALSARRFFRFWTGTGTEHGSPIFAVHAVATTLLGLTGLWMLMRQRRWKLLLLLATPLVFFPVPYYITHAEFRYRLVIDPLLTLLAGYAATRMVRESTAPKP